jgi:hypothetical protein
MGKVYPKLWDDVDEDCDVITKNHQSIRPEGFFKSHDYLQGRLWVNGRLSPPHKKTSKAFALEVFLSR